MDQFMFVITLQWKSSESSEDSLATNTVDGTVDAHPGLSRLQLARDVINFAKDKLNAPDSVVVLFLYLEPNEL